MRRGIEIQLEESLISALWEIRIDSRPRSLTGFYFCETSSPNNKALLVDSVRRFDNIA